MVTKQKLIFLLPILFVLKTSKNAMKHMILSFRIRVDVISGNFLMLWLEKDSLDRVGFRIYSRGSRFLNQKVTFFFSLIYFSLKYKLLP